MITPSEVLGLSGAAMEMRVRRALRRMSDAELTRAAARLREDALRGGLTYDRGGKPEPIQVMLRPLLMMPEQWDYVHHVCEKILEALKRLPSLYLEDDRVRRILGVGEEEEAWFREAWSPAISSRNPVYGRLDAVCDFTRADWRDSLKFLEPNMSGIGGIYDVPVAEQTVLRDIVTALQKHDTGLVIEAPPDQRELLLQLLLDHAQALGRPMRNLCFIEPLDVMEGPNEQPSLMRFFSERHGVNVVHADPRELRLQGDEVYWHDVCVDIVYRDYEVRDLIALGRREGHDMAAMRALFRQNRVVSSIGGDFDHKSCWEILTDDSIAADYFSAEERQIFHRHILWTRLLSDRKTTLPRGEGDLAEYARLHREELVLKLNRSYGGYGVTLGAHMSEGEWETLIDRALSLSNDPEQCCVVQTATGLPVTEFPVIDERGRIHEEPFFVVLGFSPTGGGLAAVARASQKAVVNLAQHGGLAVMLIGHPPSELRIPRRSVVGRHDGKIRLRRWISDLRSLDDTLSLLGWDEETYLPRAAHDGRGEQTATVESLRHRLLVDDELGDLIDEVAAQESRDGRLSIELDHLRRKRRISLALPDALVRSFARARSRALVAWEEARKLNDFRRFSPAFNELLGLVRERAGNLRITHELYDGLLDEYEPGMTRARLEPLLTAVGERLAPLVLDLAARTTAAAQVGMPAGSYSDSTQERFCHRILTDIGFDFSGGRVDRSIHPSTILAGGRDVRITMRFPEDDPLDGIFSALHEGGHALYDQGFGLDLCGTLLAEGAGMGLHESQARLWENHVGRSHAFWEHYVPALRDLFPALLKGVEAEDIHRIVNAVRPGVNRVGADEVTYNLHILLRYRLELALLGGDLPVEGIPEAWADQSKNLLGIRPSSDLEGCLQDIHWSLGSFGYFPSYALGNFYASQLMEAFLASHKTFEEEIRAGDFSSLLRWLREKVHRHGHGLSAEMIVEKATGRPLDAEPFFRRIAAKHACFCKPVG
ncbi:MAG: carboxypeptidase M32 [Victivallales bacterium]